MLVDQHLSSKEIALRLGISPHTVDQRVRQSLQILGVEKRGEAARMVAAAMRASDDPAYQRLIHQPPYIDDAPGPGHQDGAVSQQIRQADRAGEFSLVGIDTEQRPANRWASLPLPIATRSHPTNEMSVGNPIALDRLDCGRRGLFGGNVSRGPGKPLADDQQLGADLASLTGTWRHAGQPPRRGKEKSCANKSLNPPPSKSLPRSARVEDVIENALEEIAELQMRMIRARAAAGVATATGHDALQHLAGALQGLISARGGIADCHGSLVEVKQFVPGLRTVGFGDASECPPAPARRADLRIVA